MASGSAEGECRQPQSFETITMFVAAKPPPAVDFAAGTFAGMCPRLIRARESLIVSSQGVAGLFVGQPLDTIKVRFQSPQYSGRYTGTLSAFSVFSNSRMRRVTDAIIRCDH